MEISVHVFGNFGKGLTQYPDDYAREIFEDFFSRANADTQMIVHRDKDLMYYGYIRKLDNKSQFIGFCVLLNSLMFNNIENLFPIFENAVDDLVARGEILKLSSKGNIVPCIEVFNAQYIDEVERISYVIKDEFSKFENETEKLPAIDYSVASNEYKTFSIEDDNEDIVKATAKYGYTYIYKKGNYDSPTLSVYKRTIKGLNTQINNLKQEIKELKEKNNKLAAKVVRRRGLIFGYIIFAIAIVGYIIYSYTENYENFLGNLDVYIITISAGFIICGSIADYYQSRLDDINNNIEKQKEELSDFKEKVGKYMPLVITDIEIANVSYDGDIETDYGNTIYSKNTMYLKPRITYYGISSGNVNFKIKWIVQNGNIRAGNSSPKGYSFAESEYIYSGEHTLTFMGLGNSTRGYWGSGTYKIEIWYGNICLKSKSITIY